MDEVKRYVGIDVAKAQLDVFIRPTGERLSVANDEVGIRRLLGQLGPSDFVILEATGGLEVPVAGALAVGGAAVAVVNPRQVGTSLVQPGGWPRPIGSMPRCWHVLERWCGPHRGHYRMRKARPLRRCLHGGAS